MRFFDRLFGKASPGPDSRTDKSPEADSSTSKSKEGEIKRHVARLASTDAKVRRTALEDLARLIAPQSIDERDELRNRVAEFLTDADEAVRIEALALLWESSRQDAQRLAWATAMLSDVSESARMLAAVWIAESGPKAHKALVPLWKAHYHSRDPFRKSQIESAIRKIESNETTLATARQEAQEGILVELRSQKAKLPSSITECRHHWFPPPEGRCTLCRETGFLQRGCRNCGIALCEWCYGIVVS